MYRVAILEDEPQVAEGLKNCCRTILTNAKARFQIACYHASGDFMRAFSDGGERFDMLLFDIVMDGDNGFNVARWVRQRDPETPIVFITQNRDFAIESYEVKALHYLVKPDYEEPLKALLEEDIEKRYQNEYFIFENGSDRNRTRIKDILYLEISGRKVAVHTGDRVFLQDGKLSDLLTRLPQGCFVRCHQGYAVNMHHMQQLQHRELELVGGVTLPVSRTYYKQMQQAFVHWFLGM